jgi:hypothetical protein
MCIEHVKKNEDAPYFLSSCLLQFDASKIIIIINKLKIETKFIKLSVDRRTGVWCCHYIRFNKKESFQESDLFHHSFLLSRKSWKTGESKKKGVAFLTV